MKTRSLVNHALIVILFEGFNAFICFADNSEHSFQSQELWKKSDQRRQKKLYIIKIEQLRETACSIYQSTERDENGKETNLLRLSSSTFPSVATIPSTSLVGNFDCSEPWRNFSWHIMLAAVFSKTRICSIVSCSVFAIEILLLFSSTSPDEWYFPSSTDQTF